ncbi:Rrf2 family transcriptional regulator [Candidatus Bipolaricaulota bacterium]|nr:Rrf2 family transcriptional regulator [Candidatus Bipolaricaulota bacterium]
MLYSRTAKYAVLALAEVALYPPELPVSTKKIAEAASVPYPLLAKIVGQLRGAQLVYAARGKHGGIQLTRPATDITVKDVVLAIDGANVLDDCPLFLAPCKCERECALHPLWRPARDAVARFYENTTLQEIASARQNARDGCTD